ncbi:RepB family plasmid replication initiator protein [Bacteroidia bacterium]|nr:RepB family plasmid replication initiator protein [Bacteroidia bacterium]GHT61615.1 RepB family plasmid replication initiator protein [Bacteroidia bacterium]
MEEKKKNRKKDKKEIVDGAIVKVRRGMPRTNKPVKLPDKITWLKQSNIITLMAYDFKTLQIRVLISVIEKIQQAMEESIHKVPVEQLSLFKEYTNDKTISFVLQYRDLGIETYQYNEVRAALKQLASIPVELDTTDPITGAPSWAVTGLLKAYIPKVTHSRQFTVEIDKEIAKAFVNVDAGFTRFIKEIAFSTQSKYTVRFYFLISSWKDKGGFSIYTDKLRKWLMLGDKYPQYKSLYQRIIRPVYEELFEKANCWFEMAEVFKEGETEPYKLNFKVIKSALSKKEEDALNLQIKNITNILTSYFKMEDKHLKQLIPLINLGNTGIVLEKITYLHEYLNKNFDTISAIPEYCLQALIKAIEVAPGIIGEEEN